MKLMLVAGARPNFMKIASIVDAIEAHNRTIGPTLDYFLVHTGQHYSEQMSHAFFKDLGLPQPNVDLEVGSSSHAHQTAEIMKRFEPVLLQERPDVLLVVGDVNSTIACSLVASKVTYPLPLPSQRPRPLVAHVEAGLRSFDRSMPEEVNRILTDVLSDLLFTSEEEAAVNLVREGGSAEKIHFVGNTMVDTLLKHRQKSQESNILCRLGLTMGSGSGNSPAYLSQAPIAYGQVGSCSRYAVVTLHRPSNVDDRATFEEILAALSVVSKEIPILFPIHPRTLNRIQDFQLEWYFASLSGVWPLEMRDRRIHGLDPLSYLDFLCLISNAKMVLTDSGGIQEETTVLGIPCVTLRQNTERPVTLTHGTNVLAGTTKEAIVHHALRQLNTPATPKQPRLWDGHAGERIIRILSRETRQCR